MCLVNTFLLGVTFLFLFETLETYLPPIVMLCLKNKVRLVILMYMCLAQ